MPPFQPGYPRDTLRVILLLVVGLIAACSDAVDDAGQPNVGPVDQYTIGGTVTGLQGTGLVLQNNAKNNLLINADGNFTFTTPINDRTRYAVTVFQQPTQTNVIEQCDVSNGAGELAGENITGIGIICNTTFTVSVNVSGYSTGNTMLLQINAADDLSLTEDGLYTFSAGLADGTPYTVTLVTPATELKTSCTLSNAGGQINNAGITDVSITCNDNMAPNVATTNPADTAINVAVDTVISAVFDEDMLAISFPTDAITMVDAFSLITGAVNYDVLSRTLSLTPDSSLALLRPYTATLSANITDLSGQSLSSNPWSFTSRDGVWNSAQNIVANLGGALRPQIALDATGNGLTVWKQRESNRWNIWANHFDATTRTWNTAQLIETNNQGDAHFPQIASNPIGHGLAVWSQSDGIRTNIWANRFDASTNTWGTAQPIETENLGDAGSPVSPTVGGPQIAMDAEGNGLAVWEQSDGTITNIWANRFDAQANTWGTAELIETGIRFAQGAQIALDPAGNGMAVWAQADPFVLNIWANRFDAVTSTWGTAQLIETDNLSSAQYPQIALDPAGNGIAVWRQWDGNGNYIWANRFDAGTKTWGKTQLIVSEIGDARNPQIALDPKGNGIAVWSQSDGNRYNIWASHFDVVTTTWDTSQVIETNNLGDAKFPHIALDLAGHGLAIWWQFDGTHNSIWTNRYNATTTNWGTAQLIETNDLGDAADISSGPKIVIEPVTGNGLAVWYQFDGVGVGVNIWTNRFE